jgi:predicted DNA-binding protein YlxM (UPF0122 family)
MSKRRLPDCATLTLLYWDKDLTQNQIADEYEVTPSAVSGAFRRCGIRTRTKEERDEMFGRLLEK